MVNLQDHVNIADHGSIVVVTPTTAWATGWMEDNVDPDATRWGVGIAVERRYVEAILEGMAVELS